MGKQLADELVALLPPGDVRLFNPYTDRCAHDAPGNGPQARRARLRAHLACSPRWILIGEAPGYQGCRYTGVAFTSERLVLEGAIPRLGQPGARLSDRGRPFSEPSATIVWKALYALGMAQHTVMWNALQLHPMGRRGPWSNGTPTEADCEAGMPAVRALLQAFPSANVIAVGRKAERLLQRNGIATHACVRHPANGGAGEFNTGLRSALQAR